MVLAAAVLLLACVLLIRVAATPSQTTSGWLAPETLTPPGPNAEDAHVALDARGNALAVWTRRSDDAYVLQAADRPAGGGWQQPVDVTPPRSIHGLQLAVTPSGDAVALWQDFASRRYAAMSAARPAGGAWGRAVRVSPGSRRPSVPRLALDPRGNAFAVWDEWAPGRAVVKAAVRPRGGDWRRPTVLTRIPGASLHDGAGADVAVAANGDALAIWTRSSRRRARGRPVSTSVQAAVRASGADWQRPVTLSPGSRYAGGAKVALDPKGNAVAVWTAAATESSFATRAQAATRPRGRRWSRPVRISAAGEAVSELEVEVDARGEATALWGRSLRQGFSIVRSSVRPLGGTWQPPVNVSPAGEQAGGGNLALDDRGNATAIWDRYTTFHEDTDQYDIVVRAATRSPRGVWQAPTDVSAAIGRNGDAQVAAGPNGPAIAIWEAVGARAVVVQAAVRPG